MELTANSAGGKHGAGSSGNSSRAAQEAEGAPGPAARPWLSRSAHATASGAPGPDNTHPGGLARCGLSDMVLPTAPGTARLVLVLDPAPDVLPVLHQVLLVGHPPAPAPGPRPPRLRQRDRGPAHGNGTLAHIGIHRHTPAHTGTHRNTPAHTDTHWHTLAFTSTHQHTPARTRTHQHTPARTGHTSTHWHSPEHTGGAGTWAGTTAGSHTLFSVSPALVSMLSARGLETQCKSTAPTGNQT